MELGQHGQAIHRVRFAAVAGLFRAETDRSDAAYDVILAEHHRHSSHSPVGMLEFGLSRAGQLGS